MARSILGLRTIFIIRSISIVVIVVIFILVVAVVRVRQPAEFAHIDHAAKYLDTGSLQAPGTVLYKRHARFAEAGDIHYAVDVFTPQQGVADGEHGRAVYYHAVVVLAGPGQEGA